MISVSIFLMILGKLWIGIYEDDEFYEKHIFIKPKPTWKSYFYSPRVSLEDQKEQRAFDEYVLEMEVID